MDIATLCQREVVGIDAQASLRHAAASCAKNTSGPSWS